MGSPQPARLHNESSHSQGEKRTVNMCNTEQGVLFDFEDKKAQQELERMMTPSARAAVRQQMVVSGWT